MMRKQLTLSAVMTLLIVAYSGILMNSCDDPVKPVFFAPTDLTAVVISDSEIKLSWTDNSDYEDGFKIERDSGAGFEQVAEVSAGITEYSDSDLPTDSFFSYRVYAYAILKASEFSELASASTLIVADIDGNNYTTVKIGNQVWLAENLKVIHYRNGDTIRKLNSDDVWRSTTIGAYNYYDNDNANADLYGALYNWYAVGDDRKLAPEGWHVATDAEWLVLIRYLGGNSVAGDKLKAVGGLNSNANATNSSGFTALPGGSRTDYGPYYNMGNSGEFWTSSEYYSDATAAHFRSIPFSHSSGIQDGGHHKRTGFSVRCVLD